MDINLQKQTYYCTAVLADKAYEHQVTADVVLPDYMPEIVRIVKCGVRPKITSCSFVGERVTLEGIAVMTLLYSCGDGRLQAYEATDSFMKTCDITGLAPGDCIVYSAEAGYLNCRASAANRAEFRGSITLSLRVTRNELHETLCDAEGAGIQLRRRSLSVYNSCVQCEKTFSMSEVVEIPSGCDSAQAIAGSRFTACITDIKQISNKLMLKGELFMHFDYIATRDGTPTFFDASMPINQIIEAEGVSENSLCAVFLNVVSYDLMLKENAEGDKRLIDAACNVSANALCYEKSELNAINDAYSTEYSVTQQSERLNLITDAEAVDDRFISKFHIDLSGTGITEIYTVACDVGTSTPAVENGVLTVKGTMELNITGRDSSGETVCTERAADYDCSHTLGMSTACDIVRLSISVTTADFVFNSSDNAEVRAELCINALVTRTQTMDILSEITVDDDSGVKGKGVAHITVCFADGGESLWDIARKYNTTAEAIAVENNITGETVSEKRMLIIPGI